MICMDYIFNVNNVQEYDRDPDNDWRGKERTVEEMVEKLDIVILIQT